MTDRYTLRTQSNLEKHLFVDVDAPPDLNEGIGKAVVLFVEADMSDAAGGEGRMALAELLNGADGGGFAVHDCLASALKVRPHDWLRAFVRRQSSIGFLTRNSLFLAVLDLYWYDLYVFWASFVVLFVRSTASNSCWFIFSTTEER